MNNENSQNELSSKELQNAVSQKQKELQAQMQLEAILRKTLTEQARQRLNNIKLVKSDLYAQTVQTILMLAQQGHLQEKLTDEQLKEILEKLSGSKREINIRRK